MASRQSLKRIVQLRLALIPTDEKFFISTLANSTAQQTYSSAHQGSWASALVLIDFSLGNCRTRGGQSQGIVATTNGCVLLVWSSSAAFASPTRLLKLCWFWSFEFGAWCWVAVVAVTWAVVAQQVILVALSIFTHMSIHLLSEQFCFHAPFML